MRFIGAFLIALPLFLLSQDSEWDRATAHAQQLFASGDYVSGEKAARRALEMAERASPADSGQIAASLLNLGEFTRVLRRYEEASKLLARAHRITREVYGPRDPAVAAVLNSQAALARNQKQLAAAEWLLREALAIDESSSGLDEPAVARDLNNLSSLLAEMKRFDEAEHPARRALAITEKALGAAHPLVATSLRNLASVRLAQGDRPEAGQLQRRAVGILKAAFGKKHPEVAAAERELAQANAAASPGTEQEIRALELRVRTRPDDPGARLQLGAMYDRQGRYPEARAQFEAVVRLDPSSRAGWEYLALLHEFEQQYQKASAAYLKAIELERKHGPPSETAYLNYGILLSKLHQHEEALQYLSEAVGKAPASAKANYELGRVLLQADKVKPAAERLARALELDSSIARAHYFLGQAYERMGQPHAAAEAFARFKQLERKSGSLRH